MANSRLEDIYRKELMSKGFLGAFISASGARIKEKTDIRGMLPQTGISGAAFEKMFGKKYRYGASGGGVRSTEGSGYNSDMSKSMEEKLTRLGVDMKIMAKNSVVFPAMARDINVMRLNMQKLVKLAGGSPTKSADMFFKRASDREAQYEGQYKKNSGGLTPTPVGEKKEGGGISGFLKGLFGVILTAGIIGQFLDNPEIRKTLKDFFVKFLTGFFEGVKKTFEFIGEALKVEEVQEAIAGAIRAIFNAILEVFKVQLAKIETPFGDLNITIGDVVAAFVGFKIAMGLLEAAILMRTANIRGGSPGVVNVPDVDKKNPNKGGGKKNPNKGGGKFGGRGPGILGGLMIFDAATGGAISSIIDFDDDRVWAISTDFEKTPYFDNTTDDERGQFSEFLEKKKYNAASKYYKSLGAKYGYTLKSKGGVSGFLGAEEWVKSLSPISVPTPAVNSNVKQSDTSVSRTPTRNAGGGFVNPSSPSLASGDSRKVIEDYLGRKINDQEHDMLMRAVYAEASANKNEYANVMAVILNRTRKNGGTIIDTLSERNAFQAVTGTNKNGHQPSSNFIRGPNEKSAAMINESASSLPGISKSLDSFSAANRNAYGPGTSVAWLDKLQAGGGKQIGQTVFAENMYRGGGGGKGRTTPAAATALTSAPNTGNALLDIFAGYIKYKEDSMKQGGGSTVVNAPVTNIAQNGGGGGSGSATPYNTDMMKYLLGPVT